MKSRINLAKSPEKSDENDIDDKLTNQSVGRIYYLANNGNADGPYSKVELLAKIEASSLVYHEGIDWTEAKNIDELKDYFKNVQNSSSKDSINIGLDDQNIKKPKNSLVIILGSAFVVALLFIIFILFNRKTNDGSINIQSEISNKIEDSVYRNVENATEVDSKAITSIDNSKDISTSDSYIQVIKVTGSSTMKSANKINYFPENVNDEQLNTWWSPESGENLNSWIKIEFNEVKSVHFVEIHNGAHYPNYPKYGDLYFKNNRITSAKLLFSDGTSEVINLNEIDEIQKISIEERKTKFIKLVPVSYKDGSEWLDICISNFKAIGS